tara:strand:- start:731 stop:3187 length:2457 start_codon:yes stop_codon:yes gene_type:complete
VAYFGNEPAKVAVKVGSGVITATELADDSITTADIIDDAITPNQLDEDGTGFQVGTLGVGAAVSGGHTLLVNGTSSIGGVNLTGGSAGDNTLYKHSNNYSYLLGGSAGLILKGKNSDDVFTIMNNSEQRQYFYTNNVERLRVDNSATTVAGELIVNSGIESVKNGSDSATSGSYLRCKTASGDLNVWMWQLGASNQFDLWNYNAGGDNAWEKALTFTTTNLNATFAGAMQVKGNILSKQGSYIGVRNTADSDYAYSFKMPYGSQEDLEINPSLHYRDTIVKHGHFKQQHDSKRIMAGAGDDLQIYHNGTDSYIDNQTGHLRINNAVDGGTIRFQTDNTSGQGTTPLVLEHNLATFAVGVDVATGGVGAASSKLVVGTARHTGSSAIAQFDGFLRFVDGFYISKASDNATHTVGLKYNTTSNRLEVQSENDGNDTFYSTNIGSNYYELNGQYFASHSGNTFRIGSTNDHNVSIYAGGADKLVVDGGTGQTTIGGKLYTTTSVSGDFSAKVYNASASGWGLQVQAGDGSGQYVFHCKDYDDTNPLFWIKGNGLVYSKQGLGIRGSTPSDSFAIVSTGPMSFGSCEEVTVAGTRNATDHTAENSAVQIELRNTQSADNTAGAIVGLDKDGLELTKVVFKNDDHTNDKGSVEIHTSDGSGQMRQRRLRIDNSGDAYWYKRVTKANQPCFMAWKNGSFMETSGHNILTSWTIKHNVGTHFDSSTGKWTVPIAGFYLVTFNAMSKGTTTGDVQFHIRRNGDLVLGSNSMSQGSNGVWRQTCITGIVECSANDYFTWNAYSNATNSSTEQVYSGSYSHISGYLLG